MFKASIFLVAAALITLAYGWVSGIDAVLYASIGFSAVAGLALLASTIADRKKYPREEPRREPPPAYREVPSAFSESPPPPPRRPVRREPRRPHPEPHLEPLPEPTLHWSEEEEGGSAFDRRDVDQQAGSRGSDDFRSRLAAALAATDDEPPPRRTDPRPTPSRAERRQKTASPPPSSEKPEVETEEVEQDWIRIDDLPGMSDVPPGGLSPARKPRKPKVAEPTDTGRARVRWPPEPEATETPVGDEPGAEEQEPKGRGDDSLRPSIRPRHRP